MNDDAYQCHYVTSVILFNVVVRIKRSIKLSSTVYASSNNCNSVDSTELQQQLCRQKSKWYFTSAKSLTSPIQTHKIKCYYQNQSNSMIEGIYIFW